MAKEIPSPNHQGADRNGRLSVDDPRFKGLKAEEARKKIVAELQSKGLLNKTEPIAQNIGTCWRCQTPVEIISRPQWFMKTRDMTHKVAERSEKLSLIPPFTKHRHINW